MTVLVMVFFAVQVAVAVTGSGAGPLLGETESEQLGGAFGGGVTTAALWGAEAGRPILSVAGKLAGNGPGAVDGGGGVVGVETVPSPKSITWGPMIAIG